MYDIRYAMNDTIDTLRILAQNQDDVSAFELHRSTVGYYCPPDGLDILISHSSIQHESFDTADFNQPVLAVVLRCYQHNFFYDWWGFQTLYPQERKQWETLIGRFIPKGADLHEPVAITHDVSPFYSAFGIGEHGTPLDVLFELSGTPGEARTLGDEWLGLLASNGHDVVAYLKKEKMLHSMQQHMTFPCTGDHDDYNGYLPGLRQLHFKLDDARPGVWWEWWRDPASEIDLLESEFIQIIKTPFLIYEYLWTPSCISRWPFRYPAWGDEFDIVAWHWPQESENKRTARLGPEGQLAMRRANRRLEKRYAKSIKSKGVRSRQMPGAWPV